MWFRNMSLVASRWSLVIRLSSIAVRSSRTALSEERLAALLPFQQINLIHIDRVFIAKEGDQNSQPHGGFGGGIDYDKDCENLPVQPSPHTREGHQIKVYRVQNQLDRHQHDDHVAAGKPSDHAQHEECCRNHEIVKGGDRNHKNVVSRRSLVVRDSSPNTIT